MRRRCDRDADHFNYFLYNVYVTQYRKHNEGNVSLIVVRCFLSTRWFAGSTHDT